MADPPDDGCHAGFPTLVSRSVLCAVRSDTLAIRDAKSSNSRDSEGSVGRKRGHPSIPASQHHRDTATLTVHPARGGSSAAGRRGCCRFAIESPNRTKRQPETRHEGRLSTDGSTAWLNWATCSPLTLTVLGEGGC